jgi:hypothetical protein
MSYQVKIMISASKSRQNHDRISQNHFGIRSESGGDVLRNRVRITIDCGNMDGMDREWTEWTDSMQVIADTEIGGLVI